MRLSVGWGLVVALLAFVAGSDSAAQGKLTEDEALTLGREAYIFGYPLVMMDVTQRVMTAVPKADGSKAPVNQFVHLRAFPDYTFTDVVSPNADTLYSIAWLDLRKEPMILSVPAMGKRYYLMQGDRRVDQCVRGAGTAHDGQREGGVRLRGAAMDRPPSRPASRRSGRRPPWPG